MQRVERLMTADELWRLPDDGKRYELVRGELLEMAPPGGLHGWVTSTLERRLGTHVDEHGQGFVFGEVGFLIGRDPDTVRAPDCAFVRKDRLPDGPPKKYIPFAPDLAVETLSPGDTRPQAENKGKGWLAAGTRLVWIVDPQQRTVTVLRAGREASVLREEEILDGEDVVPGFAGRVGEIFG